LVKKFLVLLVTFAMLCTLAPALTLAEETTTATTTPTVPYSDIFGTPFESAFIKLHLMGIFTGYPDKTFKPDRPITRAEFLAVTLRALNFEKYVSGFKGATKYPDTPVDHWATGYINSGTAFGIVKGYPDGTFRPDSNVTYAEACTMLVRMLGYTQYITPVTPGGGTEDWFANFVKMAVAMGDPAGYGLNVQHGPLLALQDGILTGVTSFNAAAPASRGDLAIMVYNSLFVECLGPVTWQSQGPIPGAFYIPTGITLAENLGFHEMETFVTNAPPYDAYAGASQIELFEGWTILRAGYDGYTVSPTGTFVPVTEDVVAWADGHGLDYPADFKPVHRLYDIPADSIWVSGKPADLTTLIGKPLRVIYQGDEPYTGQQPYTSPAKLWYVRVLNYVTENYKVAANKIGNSWFPGKTVGEIFSDLALRVYQADPAVAAKSASTLKIDPRAVIFLEDVYIENPNVMLVKDADITVIRGVSETEFVKDYEGHLTSSLLVSPDVWAVLAKVWPGHIIKDVMPYVADAATYDKWGRVTTFGTLGFSFTDDNTFNKRLPTHYPTFADTLNCIVEDDAKFVLGGGDYTNWNWYTAAGAGYSALDWFYTNYYPVGTVRLAPIKLYPIYDTSRALPNMLFPVYPVALPEGSELYVANYNTGALVKYAKLPGFGGANVSGDPTSATIQVSLSNANDPTKYADSIGTLCGFDSYHAWLYSGGHPVAHASMSWSNYPDLDLDSATPYPEDNPLYLGDAKVNFTVDLTTHPVDSVVITLEETRAPQVPGDTYYEGSIGGTFSVIHFEGNEVTQSGTLQDIYRTKDQWGNDWITSIKISGKTYDVLFPGRGEFPAIAASITGTKEEPTAPVGQVGGVESGATFISVSDDYGGAELVFNNLWNERDLWLGQTVDICLNKDGKVRFMNMPEAAAAAIYSEYGMVTRVNMNQDSAGYHLSIDVMKSDGSVVNYPLSEVVTGWAYVINADGSVSAVPASYAIIARFSYYNEHNRGVFASTDMPISGTDYDTVYQVWQQMQNLVRDLVKLTKFTKAYGSINAVDALRIQELATNPVSGNPSSEGIIDESGTTFDGTFFSLENTSREQLYWTIPQANWKPNPIPALTYTTPWLVAKDMVTVPWSSNMTLQPGTVIYDATLPAPNVPTPDGNILIKHMADLQREQFVQVFFQPAYETANPKMIDWALVNGAYAPVVKFIVIRPMLGTGLKLLGTTPTANTTASPTSTFAVKMQFNEPLNTDPTKSYMALFNTTTGTWFTTTSTTEPYCGKLSFTQTGIYPNDTMVFTPCGLVPGHYLVFYNAVDADTGTEVKTGTWEFDLSFTPGPWTFSGTVTATGIGVTTPSVATATVSVVWTDKCGVDHTLTTTTAADGTFTLTNTFYNYYNVTVTVNVAGLFDPHYTITIDPPSYTKAVDPIGGSYTGLDFKVYVH